MIFVVCATKFRGFHFACILDLTGLSYCALSRAMGGRGLKGVSGPRNNSCVALWYQHGQPVMGSMWDEGGVIKCLFGWGGHEYRDKIGSIQVLAYDPKRAGFKVMNNKYKLYLKLQSIFISVFTQITWLPYAQAVKVGGEWRPVKVKDCAPCVIVDRAGVEHLGRCQISEEKAAYPDGGKEHTFVGPQVQNFYVLCRTN